jgi:hypothetical protein
MNLSSQPIVLPTNYHRRRMLTTPVFINASPIAVNNKIKAIQARKPRLIRPSDYDYTDIRPLNIAHDIPNSSANFSVLTAERLVDRSKCIRLDRIPTRQPVRRSVLSTTSANQQSLLWANYQSSTGFHKQSQTQSHSTTITPPVIGSTKNKSVGGQTLDIHQRRTPQVMIEQQNSLTPIKSEQKSSKRTNNNIFPLWENEENLPVIMDDEFEQYLEKAIVKCADWLLKYVFNEKSD